MRKVFGVALLFLAVATFAAAAEWVNNSISVTATSQTFTFDQGLESVWIKNDGATNELYVCLWRRGDTVTACSTSTPQVRMLLPGESKSWPRGGAASWAAVGLVCDAAETTTARGDSTK